MNSNTSTDTSNCLKCRMISRCFKSLTTEQLRELSDKKVTHNFRKREVIARQGTPASHIVFIKSGFVKLYIESETNENEMIVNLFGRDQLVGLSSLFDGRTYQYSVATLTETQLCMFAVTDINQLIESNKQFALSLLKRSHRNNMFAYKKMYELTHKQMPGRIASVLLDMSERLFHSHEFEMLLSRAELGQFTAMSTMSATRTINDFRKQGLLTETDGHIILHDIEALQRISIHG